MKKRSVIISAMLGAILLAIPMQSQAFFFGFSASVAVAGGIPIMQDTIQATGATVVIRTMATVATVVILITLMGTIPFIAIL